MRTKNILLIYVLVIGALSFSLSYAEDNYYRGIKIPDVYTYHSSDDTRESTIEYKWLKIINGPISNTQGFTFFNGDSCIVGADDITKTVTATADNKLMTIVVKPVSKDEKHCPIGAVGLF